MAPGFDRPDLEDWLLDAGDAVINKESELGQAALSPIERLTYCLWVADYGMRNAGDLDAAEELHASFQEEAVTLATLLHLNLTRDTFAMTRTKLEKNYFKRFVEVCEEIKNASR